MIANRTWPNSNLPLPFAGAIYPSGIARCCVFLCTCGLKLVHMYMQAGALGGGAGGSMRILALVVIKPTP